MSQPNYLEGHSSPPKGTTAIKLILLFFVVGIVGIGKTERLWPIISWPVYSIYTKPFPDSTASVLKVKAISKNGEQFWIEDGAFFSEGRTNVEQELFEYAFLDSNPLNQRKNRSYLAHTVTRLLKNAEVETIEGWQFTWAVEPLSVPPLVIDNPESEVLLDRFAVDDYLKAKAVAGLHIVENEP